MCCSQPNSSPSSSKIALPPASITWSQAMPIAGFAVRPLVASEPPHSVATIRSASSTGRRGTTAISASASRTHSRPAWIVERVPPVF